MGRHAAGGALIIGSRASLEMKSSVQMRRASCRARGLTNVRSAHGTPTHGLMPNRWMLPATSVHCIPVLTCAQAFM